MDCTKIWIALIYRDNETFVSCFTSRKKAFQFCIDDIVEIHADVCHTPSIDIEEIVENAKESLCEQNIFYDKQESKDVKYEIEEHELN